MSQKANIMSLSIERDLQDKLKRHAKTKDVTVSKLVRDLIDKYVVMEEDVIPVILKVPLKLKGDQDGLQKWMTAKSAAIVNALSS